MLPTKINRMDRWLLQKAPQFGNALPILTTQKVKLIENSSLLTIPEKKELLLILFGYKFSTELSFAEKEEKAELLLKLELPFHVESRVHSQKGKIRWLQVSANERIDRFVKKYSSSMSAMEAGLLYGYPYSAILAFMGLIPRMEKLPSDGCSKQWFGLVRSKHLFELEERYFREIIDQIARVSQIIHSELKSWYSGRKS